MSDKSKPAKTVAMLQHEIDEIVSDAFRAGRNLPSASFISDGIAKFKATADIPQVSDYLPEPVAVGPTIDAKMVAEAYEEIYREATGRLNNNKCHIENAWINYGSIECRKLVEKLFPKPVKMPEIGLHWCRIKDTETLVFLVAVRQDVGRMTASIIYPPVGQWGQNCDPLAPLFEEWLGMIEQPGSEAKP